MPYATKKKGANYVVVNTETGMVKATHKPPGAKSKAIKQLKLLDGIERGWKPTGEPDTFERGGKRLHISGGSKRGTD